MISDRWKVGNIFCNSFLLFDNSKFFFFVPLPCTKQVSNACYSLWFLISIWIPYLLYDKHQCSDLLKLI